MFEPCEKMLNLTLFLLFFKIRIQLFLYSNNSFSIVSKPEKWLNYARFQTRQCEAIVQKVIKVKL